jgi:hypothetical protein
MVGTEQYLSGIKSVEDAAGAVSTLGPGLDAVAKACR